MPPLIAAVLLGAGAYAGFRAAQHVWSLVGAARPADAGVSDRKPAFAVKDLGQLERDPETGVYRPVERG